jgi:sulfonate transport system substrate-binding protein
VKLHSTLAALAATVVTVAVAACGTSPGGTAAPVPPPVGPADLAKVTLKIGDQKGNQKAVLAAAGLLDNTPYKIEWSTFTSGPPLLEAASAGAIDVGGVGNTPPIFAAASSGKIAAVSVLASGVTGDGILVPRDSPIQSLADLRGRTIGVTKGSSAHGVLLKALHNAGLSPGDVKISYLQPSDAYAAFRQHALDAWSIWDPYSSQARLEAGARVLVDGTGRPGGTDDAAEPPADGSGLTNGDNFEVAGKAALADAGKNTAIRDYVVRIAKAWQWARTHEQEWGAAWAAETGLSPAVAAAAVRHISRRPVALDDAVVGSQQQLADTFSDARVLPGRVRFADYVDRRYNDDVLAATR